MDVRNIGFFSLEGQQCDEKSKPDLHNRKI